MSVIVAWNQTGGREDSPSPQSGRADSVGPPKAHKASKKLKLIYFDKQRGPTDQHVWLEGSHG